MFLNDVMTVPASLAGLPAMSLPVGSLPHAGTQVPVGLQLVGPHNGELLLLQAAAALEAQAKFSRFQ